MKVLIIEDNEKINSLIVSYLKEQGIDAEGRLDGVSGLDEAKRGIYDVLILDLMIPGMDGLHVLENLRKNGNNTPVLILTAKDSLDDKMRGFDIGADDYLTKPFAFEELTARVKSLARRKGTVILTNPSFGDIELDETSHEMKKGESSIHLGTKEFFLFQFLIRNSDHPIDKDVIANKLWDSNDETTYNSVEVYISFLRRKLSALHSSVTIRSLRGIGYALAQDSNN